MRADAQPAVEAANAAILVLTETKEIRRMAEASAGYAVASEKVQSK